MKTNHCPEKNSEPAFTLIELMFVLAVLLFVAAIYLPAIQQRNHATSQRITCVNNLKQVGLAFRTFSLDNNDHYPMQTAATNGTLEVAEFCPTYLHFQVMSNELTTPRILRCPEDAQRPIWATNWTSDLSNGKISYFVGLAADETHPQMFLTGDRNLTNGQPANARFIDFTTNRPAGWTHQLHKLQGNVGFADGSVQQLSTTRLQTALRGTGDATNRLAMPY
jgi:prepilin-type N-terminal cleavage/methylation domain-containing protein/prepilin-type processing-associated H-X9-DG protein